MGEGAVMHFLQAGVEASYCAIFKCSESGEFVPDINEAHEASLHQAAMHGHGVGSELSPTAPALMRVGHHAFEVWPVFLGYGTRVKYPPALPGWPGHARCALLRSIPAHACAVPPGCGDARTPTSHHPNRAAPDLAARVLAARALAPPDARAQWPRTSSRSSSQTGKMRGVQSFS